MSDKLEIIPFRRRDLTWETSPEFLAQRDEALGMSALVTVVNSVESNETASTCARELGELRRAATAFHKEAKAPIIRCGRDLDAKLADAIDAIAAEETRLARLTGDYLAGIEAQRRATAAAAEATAKAEQNKLQEALSKTADIDEQIRIREQAAFEAQQHSQQVAVPMPTRAKGQQLKEVWEITVTNEFQMARWAIDTCLTSFIKIEVKKTEIEALLDRGIQIPGVEAKKVNKTVQR